MGEGGGENEDTHSLKPSSLILINIYLLFAISIEYVDEQVVRTGVDNHEFISNEILDNEIFLFFKNNFGKAESIKEF